MTAEGDDKSTRTGQPDLLASLPAESPPATRPDPGIDPAAIEELLTGVRDLREQIAGLREAVSTERSAPEPAALPEAVPEATPQALTLEALESWGDTLVARVAEAAQIGDAPGDDAAAAVADHAGRIEEAAAKAAAAAERIDRGMETTADRVAAGIEEAVTRIETGLTATRSQVTQHSRLVHETLDDIRTQTAGPRFGWRAILLFLIVFVLGMLLESHIHLLYRWQ